MIQLLVLIVSLLGLPARNLLPFAIGVPLLPGWLCLEWQSTFGFKQELCIGMMVVTIIVLFAFIIYGNAVLINCIDTERKEAREKIVELLVVQALQGTITVQSLLGEGTTFTIELPNPKVEGPEES